MAKEDANYIIYFRAMVL